MEEKTIREEIEDALDNDEGEQEQKTETVETKAEIPGEKDPDAKPEDESDEPVVPDTPELPGIAAPIGWSPAVRDKFKDLDKDMQTAIADREQEVNATLQDSSESRRVADQFIRTMEPFRALMAAEGANDPFQAIQGLMNVTATLAMGTPAQKAQRIAGLIQHYSIDIELLDQNLVGTAPVEAQMPVDPRIDQIWNYLQNGETTRQNQMESDAGASVQEFSKAKAFMDDPKFRNTMANFLDISAQNGQGMSLDEAHASAIASMPEYASVVAKQSARTASETVAGKKAAASSLSGHRGGGSDTPSLEDMSLRDSIAAQFDANDRI